MKRKLSRRGGFTLSEMLVAVVILGLLTLVVTTGISAGTQVYRKSVEFSHAQVLLSTLSQSVAEELRYASDLVVVDGGGQGTLTGYTSAVYGPEASIAVLNGAVESDRRVVVRAAGTDWPLLGEGTYGDFGVSVKIQYGAYAGGGEEDCFTVTAYILRAGETETTAFQSRTFLVRALNPAEAPQEQPPQAR